MINPNANLVEQAKVVQMFAPATPGNVTHDVVSLKGYERCTIIISCNNATTVTGADVSLVQLKTVGNSPDVDKALGFTTVYANTDTGASDALVKTTVVANTFTTDETNDKNLVYVIEVKADDLDVTNGYDCVAVATAGTAASTVVDIVAVLWPAKYGKATPLTAIAD